MSTYIMDTSIFEDLGLTGAEIKVFLTLLELGSSAAGKVVEKSGLHNAVVHRAFHSLAEKGLVTHVVEGKMRQYRAVPPNSLLQFIEEKKERLQKILPELEAKQKLAQEKPTATLFQGIRGVKELLHLILDTKAREYYAYGGPKKANEMLGDYFWESFHNKRTVKGIKGQLIFHSSLRYWGEQLQKKKLTTIQYTNEKFEELTETIICGNRVAIIIWLEKPYGFLIEEKSAAASYAQFFEILWKNSKK
ncbi:MAG: helix-turn-helix domain-containing protein [Nanoarchaeota archaeon]|nr:helix-turn-helix domain-containing protein [Nanoarchaeota archaeon]